MTVQRTSRGSPSGSINIERHGAALGPQSAKGALGLPATRSVGDAGGAWLPRPALERPMDSAMDSRGSVHSPEGRNRPVEGRRHLLLLPQRNVIAPAC